MNDLIEYPQLTEEEVFKYNGSDETSFENDNVTNLNTFSKFFTILDKLLEDIHKSFGVNVIIAGGAIRDALLNRPVKDIDVFIGHDNLNTKYLDTLSKILECPEYKQSEAYYGQMTDIVDFKINKFGIPIQLIFVKSLTKHYDSFTVNISKVKYDNTGLTISREFLEDVKNNKITFTKSLNSDRASFEEKYIKRISKKYPGWKFCENI